MFCSITQIWKTSLPSRWKSIKKKIAKENHQDNFLLFSCSVFDKTYALCVLGTNACTLNRCKIRYYHSYGTIDIGGEHVFRSRHKILQWFAYCSTYWNPNDHDLHEEKRLHDLQEVSTKSVHSKLLFL